MFNILRENVSKQDFNHKKLVTRPGRDSLAAKEISARFHEGQQGAKTKKTQLLDAPHVQEPETQDIAALAATSKDAPKLCQS